MLTLARLWRQGSQAFETYLPRFVVLLLLTARKLLCVDMRNVDSGYWTKPD